MRAIYKIKRVYRNTIIFLSEIQDKHEMENGRRWGE